MHLTVAMEGVNDRTLAQQARQFQLAPAALSHFSLDPQRARSGRDRRGATLEPRRAGAAPSLTLSVVADL